MIQGWALLPPVERVFLPSDHERNRCSSIRNPLVEKHLDHPLVDVRKVERPRRRAQKILRQCIMERLTSHNKAVLEQRSRNGLAAGQLVLRERRLMAARESR
eukprot:TRINITY_DN7494_c0_g1_i1.p2 TRINITY_DN7494_c0_g1~~TRINITY_DN7494_c0_g1_i1.p2  ORF type:complete len:102 (+),score=5.89 TRINITY_DN7494_c0_g1_i1:149-454(+)